MRDQNSKDAQIIGITAIAEPAYISTPTSGASYCCREEVTTGGMNID